MSGIRRRPRRPHDDVVQGGLWVALLIIAAMVMASYLLLQQMMADARRRGAAVADRARRRRCRTRSRCSSPTPPTCRARPSRRPDRLAEAGRPPNSRRTTTSCLDSTGADPASAARNDPTRPESVLFRQAPFHLDYFSAAALARRRLALRRGTRACTVGPASPARLSRRQGAGRSSTRPWPTPRLPAMTRSARASTPSRRRPVATTCSASTGRCSARRIARHRAGRPVHLPADVAR